jgi:hypothetical protein
MGGEENISMKAIFNLSIAYNMLIFFEFDTKKNFLFFLQDTTNIFICRKIPIKIKQHTNKLLINVRMPLHLNINIWCTYNSRWGILLHNLGVFIHQTMRTSHITRLASGTQN